MTTAVLMRVVTITSILVLAAGVPIMAATRVTGTSLGLPRLVDYDG
jgi:hypothetical protein